MLQSAAFYLRPEMHKRDKELCDFSLIKKGLAISGFLAYLQSVLPFWNAIPGMVGKGCFCAIIDLVLASARLARESAETLICYLWDCIHDNTA